MEMIKQHRNRLILAGLIVLIAGIMIGLLYGYVIDPVEWVDAPIELTRNDIQEDYLRMAIDSYKFYFDPTMAYYRWQELGSAGPKTLARIMASPDIQGTEAVKRFKDLVTIQDTITATTACEGVNTGTSSNLCLYLWLGTVILGGGSGFYFYSRLRNQIVTAAPPRKPAPKKAQGWVDKQPSISLNGVPPLVHTMTTFMMGDDLFDESFSIDTPSGEFLGECGIGVVSTIDDETPKKVNAFDIWLFDKNEIHTKSIVLMSDQAYNDEILVTKLKNKGLPILAEVGGEISLKTTHLLMSARVVDMLCEEGQPQECLYFQRLSLEIFVRKLK